jgi:hypothetical protein|nr:MAG TPA: protein of unknown function (DUF5401) [Herelleviridae sp.]
MLFGKKDKAAADGGGAIEDAQAAAPAQAPAVDARAAKDSLTLVIDETEPGAALDIIRQNTEWLLPNGIGVILALPVDASIEDGGIGGLGKVSSKGNEDKGSILQRIADDKIQVCATEDMLRHNILGVIPTPASLGPDGMGEYTLFDRAKFLLTSVTPRPDGTLETVPVHFDEATGLIEVPDGDIDTVTLAQAQEIASGTVTLASLIPTLWKRLGGEADVEEEAVEDVAPEEVHGEAAPAAPTLPPTAAQSESVEAVENLPHFDPDDIPDEPMVDELPSDEGLYDEDDEDENPFDDIEEAPAPAPHVPTQTEEAEVAPEVAPVDERVFNKDAVRTAVARRFLDDSLDFAVDMTPFETLLGYEVDTPAQFSLDHLDSTNWLDGQIKMLSQQANTVLADQRRRDIEELRNLFFSLVSRTGDEISSQMSIDEDAENTWAKTMAEVNGNETKALADLIEISEKEKAVLADRYQQEREAFIQARIGEERVRYDERHKPALTRQMDDLEASIRLDIESDYEARRYEILRARKTSAQGAFDAAITKVMDHLIEKRAEQVQREAQLIEKFRVEMNDFLDENRKEDIARTQALQEQLSRQNIVEEKSAEFAAREQELHEQIARERDEAQKRVLAAQDEANKVLERMRQENAAQLAQARAEVERANERVKEEAERVGVVRDEIARQFQSQVESLQTDKQLLMDQMDRENLVAKRANRLYIALAVLVALAFLALGVIIGMLVHGATGSSAHAASMMSWVMNSGAGGGTLGV